MPLLIGMDEAGLGPNLGPYVVTATVWETGEPANKLNLWQAAKSAVTDAPQLNDDRLHIADSKAVFQPGKGLAALERGVLAACQMLENWVCRTDLDLRRRLLPKSGPSVDFGPCYSSDDLNLPLEADAADIRSKSGRWQSTLESAGIQLLAVRSTIVEPMLFNLLIDEHQNKARALSLVSLRLLQQVLAEVGPQLPALVYCDKHGGRDRYDLLLAETFPDEFVFRVQESSLLSVYRLGNLEVRFLPRAESHLPVALASMVSKYVRELAMLRFNRFWMAHIPGLKPTQGYPVDARRFRDAIAETQQSLRIPDNQLWRCR
ncbi:MAG: hypothetical protein U0872_00505 [Planctomycetaceae bacterium]